MKMEITAAVGLKKFILDNVLIFDNLDVSENFMPLGYYTGYNDLIYDLFKRFKGGTFCKCISYAGIFTNICVF